MLITQKEQQQQLSKTIKNEQAEILTSIHAPKFLQCLRDVQIEVLGALLKPITMEVKATGKPKPKLNWFHNDQQIQFDTKINNMQIVNLSSESHSQLIFRNQIDAKQLGVYSVVATNVHGQIQSRASLRLNVRPPLKHDSSIDFNSLEASVEVVDEDLNNFFNKNEISEKVIFFATLNFIVY